MKSNLEEMPQLIPCLNDITVKEASLLISKAIKDGSATQIDVVRNQKIYQVGDLIAAAIGDQPTYVVRHKQIHLRDSAAGRQILIKRLDPRGPGIGQHIFWNILFPKYKVLATDSQQTTQGQGFWLYRVHEALQKRIPVTVIDTNGWVQTPYTSLADFEEDLSSVWGTSSWFQRMIVKIG